MKDRSRGTWHKSSYSNGGGGNCVEVAHTSEPIRVRDSKDPGGPELEFSGGAWDAFVREVQRGGTVFGGE
ncbi:DUF397 domain-containing protein [Streptomyces sp. NBC_01477]|uniref:DUF397 domain-containing protein n=1 Tax=Streptomyces sp. NBC_01477 TaxID=2976015 RepID=UPI002E37B159|nr:DUF397 domain-containing protein [Streptomyces sp. NBC_01477]